MENLKKQQNEELKPNWSYRMQGFANLLRMGHCAPTSMKTILDVSSMDKEWLVRFSAGMPGGIGNTGHECGAFTSPLALLGIRLGLRDVDRGLPVIFDKGHALCRNFLACHKTLQCKEIRGKDRFPAHCIAPVLRSPELYMNVLDDGHGEVISAAKRDAYASLYSYMRENEFHCAKAVFTNLGYTSAENPELFDALSAFIGGTLLMGKTCSAFTAGVMAIGLKTGEIEDSIPRVVRLLSIMTVGGNAFDDRLNKFNRSMNRGYRLSKWFVKEFGSNQCQAITQCDFSDLSGVNNYINSGCITKCRKITEKVAEKVQAVIST